MSARRSGDGGSKTFPITTGWIFLVALGAVTLAFFWTFVRDASAVLFGTDMLGQAYQSRAFAVSEVEAGRGLPLWNPFVFGGLPYLSILPYPVYYPTSLLYFVMPLHRAIGWAFALHFLVAGGTMYALVKELRLSSGAAIVAGASYAFTGYLVSHLYAGQDGRMFAMSWTPALFFFAERSVGREESRWLLGVSAVVALQTFTPHVQMMYFAAMGVAAYVAFRLIQLQRSGRPLKTVGGLAAAFIGAYGLAGLITLVEVWPTFNMLQYSHRLDRGYAYASSWSMPVRETLATLFPGFQGYLQSYWGTNPFKLHTEYLGAIPILLCVVALVVRRCVRVWFFAVLALGALLFAWGGATPLHRVLYETLPIMKSFRAPAMMFSVVALCIAVLAAFGADAVSSRAEALATRTHLIWKIVVGIGLLLTALWIWALYDPNGFGRFWAGLLYGTSVTVRRSAGIEQAMAGLASDLGYLTAAWWAGALAIAAGARRRIAPVVACAILASIAVADLWRVDRDFYGIVDIEDVVARDPAIAFLQAQSGPFRVWPLPTAYGPNDLMLFGLETVTGSQNFRLSWWDDLVGEDLSGLTDSRTWSLLNVRYIVSRDPIDVPGFELVHDGVRRVYEPPGTERHAWVVHRARRHRVTAGGERFPADFDPSREALLGDDPLPPLAEPAGGPATIEWVERQPGHLVVETGTTSAGILVMSEVYHPYWEATLDGHPVEVMRVNIALRGVAVPEGTHRIEMHFRDPYLGYGRLGSLIGIVLWAGLLAAAWRRTRDHDS